MKRYTIHTVLPFAAVAVLLLVCSCRPDDDESLKPSAKKVLIVPSLDSHPMLEVTTRAANDRRYGDYIEADKYPVGTKISVSFYNSQATPAPSTTVTEATGTFEYLGNKNALTSNSKWGSTVRVEPNIYYKVFGHVPHDCCSSFTYEFSDDAANAKANTITLNNLVPVNNTDVSVVVGVGRDHYYSDDARTTNKEEEYVSGKKEIIGAYPQKFYFLTTDKAEENTIYLLMDHLFVQTKFHFAIGADYHRLRDIRIRKIELSAPEVKSLSATVHLINNPKSYKTPEVTTAIEKIDWDMEKYGASETPGTATKAAIYDCTKIDEPDTSGMTDTEKEEALATYNDQKTNGFLLTEDMQLVAPGFFSPLKVDDTPITFKLTTEYDVYDKKGNKIRSAESSMNYYATKKDVEVKSGTSYDVHLTVKPTYLYQLSDGDLDNPDISVVE